MSDQPKGKEVAEDYRSALADLHVNSKPLITMLTMLADENKSYAHVITQVIINHIKETSFKLPAMYLVDSIVKNVGNDYKRLFGNSIASIFAGVFLDVDEKTRRKLYELRQTWNEVFPKSRLFLLDTNIREIDPAWPMTSQPRIITQPTSSAVHVSPPTIHVNPKFKTHDMEELKKLQTEKKLLQEKRIKVEKMMQEQPSKPDVSSKTGSVEHNHSPNSIIDRREFLRHYKIKKKALSSENKTNDIIQPHIGDKVQNIHIAPWKAKEILPNIASSSTPPRDPRDPRLASTSTSRDPRVAPDDRQGEKEPIKLLRDPRVTSSRLESPIVSQRDPRLLSKPVSSSPKPSPKQTHPIIGTNVSSTPTAALVQHPRDPRTVQAEKSVEKERDSNSSKAKKEKEKEHMKSPKDSSTPKREKEKKVKPKESEKNKENEKIEELKKTDKGIHSKKIDLDPKTVKTEAKKGIVKSEKKDSPKENLKESPKNKENKNQKSKEKDKIDKENLEKLNKEKAAEKSIREKAEKSNKEKVVEKLNKEKIEKPPKEKSVEKNIKEKDRQSKEKSLEKHIVSAAPKEEKETPSLKAKIKDLSLSPVEKFKSKGAMSENDNGSKRRKHIRPRVESPVEDIKDVKQEESLSQNTDNDRPSSTGSSSSSGKRSRNDRDSESEDSDHYEANKPSPSVYANKKVKGDNGMNVSAVPLASQSQSFNNPVKSDTDLRHFTPQQDSRHPVEIDKTDKMTELRPNPEKTLNLGLFGKEDVDLRQLSIMARVPHANQGTSAVLTNFGSKPDEDMRIQSNSRKENQDPRFNKSLDTFASPLRKEDEFADHNSKKTFYNSPHAAKWEKFREKNPEFKEYQRQASVSEKMDIDDRFSPPTENFHLPGKSGFGKWERGRRRYSHDRELCQRTDKLPKDFEPIDEEDTNKSSDENYKFMINQLTEQLKRGEINDNEFSRYMENIRFMVEKGKIRELQRKERGSSEGRWSPDRRSVTSLDSEEIWPKHPAEKVASNQQYIDDGRWSEGGNSRMDSWQRGHVRDHGPPVRGPGIRLCYGGHSRFEDEWTNEPDLPNIAEDVLRSVYRESQTKTIEIDGIPREIRTYGERAMILMDWDDPRTLTFEPVLCNIVFDNGTFVLPMSIGEGYREFIIDREVHRVRLGVPTQELMIDGKGYQCFFGGKPITVHLAGQNRTISLDGKLPKVIIGQTRNTNYLLGKIELIVNARKVIPLFLDAKPQRFTLDGKAFVIKFIDAFTKVNINGVKFPVEFGGLPISITVRGYRKFLRFLKLPSFVTPGKTTVRGMDTEGDTLIPAYPPSPPPPPVDIKRAPNFPSSTSVAAPSPAPTPTPVATAPPLAPSLAPALPLAPSVTPATPLAPSVAPAVITSKVPSQHTPEINIPTTLPSGSAPGPFHFHSQPPPTSGGIPPGIMLQVRPPLHPNIRNVVPGSYLTSSGVSNKLQQPPPMLPIVPGNIPLFSQPPPSLPSNVSTAPASTASTSSSPAINVQDLLDRLVKTGIIGGQNSKKDPKKETKNEEDKHERKEMKESVEDEEELNFLKDIPSGEMMFTLDNLRKINSKLVKVLHRGMQCSSCGLRYPPEGTQQYSHHLDWHFRMNKKQQDSTKKVNTRKFYFTMEDWVQFEEIEDIEERVPSMFEVEGQMNSKSSPNENDDEEEEIPSVAVSPDPSLGVCPICHETFDQFYHQTTEDWHYKYAIQVDGINYHPGCHEDHLKALKQEEERQRKAEEEALRAKLEEEERLKKEAEEEAKKAEEEAKKAEEEAKKAEEDAKIAEDEAKIAEEEAKKAEEEMKIAEEESAKKADEETSVVKTQETESTENKEVSSVFREDEEIEEINEIKMDVDEDIQEIEKVKDDKPKLEIDLTSEEPKLVTEEVKSDEPTDKVKKTSLDKVKDALRNISAISNGLSPFRIKEEAVEGEGEMKIYTPYLQPRILADIPIKMEIEDEEDNLPLSYDVEDDDEDLQEIRVNQNDSWMAPAPITTAETDIASSIDGNTELTTSAEVSVPKIKISVSLPTRCIIEEHLNAVNNGNNNYSSSSDETSSDDADSWHNPEDDFIPPPFTVDYTRKPAFRGVQLKDQPLAQRGVEISSLCSIM